MDIRGERSHLSGLVSTGKGAETKSASGCAKDQCCRLNSGAGAKTSSIVACGPWRWWWWKMET